MPLRPLGFASSPTSQPDEGPNVDPPAAVPAAAQPAPTVCAPACCEDHAAIPAPAQSQPPAASAVRWRPEPAQLRPGERWCPDCGEESFRKGSRCPRCGSPYLIDPAAILRPGEYVIVP